MSQASDRRKRASSWGPVATVLAQHQNLRSGLNVTRREVLAGLVNNAGYHVVGPPVRSLVVKFPECDDDDEDEAPGLPCLPPSLTSLAGTSRIDGNRGCAAHAVPGLCSALHLV